MRRIIDLLLPHGIPTRCAECQTARTTGGLCGACEKRQEAVAAYLRLRVRQLHASSTRWGQLAEDVRARSRQPGHRIEAALDALRAERPLTAFDPSLSQGHANVHPTSPLVGVPLDPSF